MIVKEKDMEIQVRSELKGGCGDIHFLNCVGNQLIPNCRLLSYMTVPPGCSIGDHEHVKETECYIIRSGKGIAVDNGTKMDVQSGDIIITRDGERHSVTNTGDEALEILAFIVME